MNVAVVVFPGSNCDADAAMAFEQLGHTVSMLWHKEESVGNADLVVLPGGFSYGDYLRSGAIARLSPVMEAVTNHANAGGLLVGICNGFQILCEAGLLPGVLLHNTSRRFICQTVNLKVEVRSPLGETLDCNRVYRIPMAHGEGNYYAPAEMLKQIEANGQVLFRYCDEFGRVTADANPNGSAGNIAGICNERGNVFGMMPHPERASSAELNNTDGTPILEAFIRRIGVSVTL